MQNVEKISAREAIMLILQKYRFPAPHHIHVDARLPTEARKWEVEELSTRMIAPMVNELLAEIPKDGIIYPFPLEMPRAVTGSSEIFQEVAVRCVSNYDIATDTMLLRLDIRFWSFMYTKQLKRQEFWRKIIWWVEWPKRVFEMIKTGPEEED